MKIVYIGSTGLHSHSGRSELTAALTATNNDIYYLCPLRWTNFILHKLGFLTYDANFDGLNYKPYLRFSRKKSLSTIADLLYKHRLVDEDTFIVSPNMNVCQYLKENMPGKSPRIVYHMVDRYSEYHKRSEEEKALFDQKENEIIKKCDIVLCVSQKLLAEALILNKQSFWFPGAVRTSQIVDPGRKNGSTATIGMISNELSRIDWPLLCDIAQELAEYTIELIGKNDLPTECYPPNVRIVGRIPYTRLGAYVMKWDAGLALYQKNRFNEYCCPLKYFEYSSFNIPTVSTVIPEGKVWAELYPELIFLADEPLCIAESVKSIVTRDQDVDYTRLARENTWDVRAERLCNILSDFRK